MIQGVSGSFDIAGSNPSTFTARIFYSEQYDKATGKHVLSIGKAITNDAGEIIEYDSGINIQSREFGYEWYPHGSISIDGAVVGSMDNSQPASHTVSLTAGNGWHKVVPYHGGADFPWRSVEIPSNPDGTKTVEIAVDFLLYRSSSTPRPSFKGSYSVELTFTPTGLVHIDEGTENAPHQIFIDNGVKYGQYMGYIDRGTGWDLLNI